MTRYADLAAKLLQDAAVFFRNVGEQNPELAAQMNDNAAVYEQVAALVAADPLGMPTLRMARRSTESPVAICTPSPLGFAAMRL